MPLCLRLILLPLLAVYFSSCGTGAEFDDVSSTDAQPGLKVLTDFNIIQKEVLPSLNYLVTANRLVRQSDDAKKTTRLTNLRFSVERIRPRDGYFSANLSVEGKDEVTGQSSKLILFSDLVYARLDEDLLKEPVSGDEDLAEAPIILRNRTLTYDKWYNSTHWGHIYRWNGPQWSVIERTYPTRTSDTPLTETVDRWTAEWVE